MCPCLRLNYFALYLILNYTVSFLFQQHWNAIKNIKKENEFQFGNQQLKSFFWFDPMTLFAGIQTDAKFQVAKSFSNKNRLTSLALAFALVSLVELIFYVSSSV